MTQSSTLSKHNGGGRIQDAYPPSSVAWYATIVLAILYWMSLLDRIIIAMLIDPIKNDLGITDTEFGLIQGAAFIFSFTFFGLIFGAFADRKDRRLLIFAGVTIWSLASAACGLAQNFWHLMLARAGLGAGESSLNPCATSMISDLHPRERLTTAMAVYSLGATVGAGSALALGGVIIVFITSFGEVTLPILGPVAPWQLVFFVVGLSTIPLAFIVFTFPEPVRRGVSKSFMARRSWKSGYADFLKLVKKHPRLYFCHYGGFILASLIGAGTTPWYPVFLMREYGWSASQVGTALGITVMACGISGKMICGWLVDGMYKRGYRDAQLRWFAWCLVICCPVGILAPLTGSPWGFVALIGLFTLLTTSMHTCAMTSLQLVTPNHLRGIGVAVYTLAGAVFGGALGAVLVPIVSDNLFQGNTAGIGLGMAVVIGSIAPFAALLLAFGCKPMREAVAEIEYD